MTVDFNNETNFHLCHILEKHNIEKNGSRHKNGINIISCFMKNLKKDAY